MKPGEAIRYEASTTDSVPTGTRSRTDVPTTATTN
jgi:hypothetical protein